MMKKMGKKTRIEVSQETDNDQAGKESEQSEEITTEPLESVEGVDNARVRRGRRNASKASTGVKQVNNEGKKRVTVKRGKASDDTADMSDDEADPSETSVVSDKQSENVNTEPVIVIDNQVNVVNDEVKPTQITDDKEEIESASEPRSGDNITTLGNVADGDSATAVSSEEVSNGTSSVDIIVGDVIATDQSKVSTESSEVAATSEQSKDATSEALDNVDEVVSKCRKRGSIDVSEPSIEVLENAVVDEEATDQPKVSTETSQEVAATSEQSKEVTTEILDNINEVSKCRKRENIDVTETSNELLGNTVGNEDVIIANKRSRLEVTDTTKADTSEAGDGHKRKVFVGGLPSTITEDKLRTYFETYGRVIQVDLIRHRDTNTLRGFAFIVFENEECANNCIQKRSHEICQKICEVRKADKNRFIGNSRGVVSRPGYNKHNNLRQYQQRNAQIGFDIPRMFNQAFLIGRQQRAYRPPVLTSPSFLLNRAPVINHLPRLLNPLAAAVQPNNILLQALLNRRVAPASTHIAPMLALASAPRVPMVAPVLPTAHGNIASLNLLAQRMKAYTQASNYRPTKDGRHIYKPY